MAVHTDDTVYAAISKQDSTLVSMVERGEKTVTETKTSERAGERQKERKTEGSPDETNSKRDVLLIILTPGVRLNERRSQTREARCKFNYREERERAGRRTRKARRRKGTRKREKRESEDRQSNCVCEREKDNEWSR